MRTRRAIALAAAGLVVGLAGCGGDGVQALVRGPGLDAGADELLVGFRAVAGFGLGRVECDVTRRGWCRFRVYYAYEGEPLGIFETRLPAADVAEIKEAVSRAAEAGLGDHYPDHLPDTGAAWVTFHEDGTLRTIETGHYPAPEELRPLYWGSSGLIPDAMEAAREHPAHTLALRQSLDKTHYQVDEPIWVHLAVANVGPKTTAFPTIDCEEIAFGTVGAAVHIRGRLESPWEWVDFGGKRSTGRGALTPAAREDLAHIVTLGPGEEYRFAFPRKLRADRPGSHHVSASLDVWLRYNMDEVEAEVGVPVITGSLQTDLLSIEALP